MNYQTYGLLILAGVVPSLAWLWFFLSKDCHPEPKRRIAQTFILAIVLAPLAIAAQWLFVYVVGRFVPLEVIATSPLFFGWASIVEEIVKLMAVTYVVYRTVDFDEPVDGMIYLITAALGFAAIENILIMFRNASEGFEIALQIWALRFFGATLLHALSSAILGYFVALAWFRYNHSRKIIFMGIMIASAFHLLFNMLLVDLSPQNGLMFSSLILAVMIFLVSILFVKVRDRSPSKLNPNLSTYRPMIGYGV